MMNMYLSSAQGGYGPPMGGSHAPMKRCSRNSIGLSTNQHKDNHHHSSSHQVSTSNKSPTDVHSNSLKPTLEMLTNITAYHSNKQVESSTPTKVSLKRSNSHTPWGFRIQGGSDYKMQLSVKKTQPGSPADSQLNSGDNIITITGTETRNLTHKQAIELIKQANTELELVITRQPGMVDVSDIKPKGQLKFSLK